MTPRKKLWLTLAIILVISGLAGVVDWPKGPDLRIGGYFKELKVRLGLDLMGGTHLVYQADTSQIPTADKADAVEGVRDVIERRVNAFGVSEPVVQTNKVGSDYRVIVELPGITDVSQAIKLIGETPLLEFREQKTIDQPELTQEEVDQYNIEAKAKAEKILDEALAPGADFAVLAKANSEDTSAAQGGDLGFFPQGAMVPEFEDVIFNKAEAGKVYPELVQTAFGYHIIKVEEKKTVTDEQEQEELQARASHILIKTKSLDQNLPVEYANTGLSGKQLKNASVQFDQTSGQPQISLSFNDEGKALFAEITKRNLNKPVAIYLDGSPISIPVVQAEITSGEAVITGSFTLDEAKTLARRLNSGALPVPITLVNQQNIGATLGRISVERSFFAGLLGLLLVAIFMIVYYRLPGLLSVLALFIYALLVLAIFKLWPVTLTLAGVAGFILSIGMAVDANVLIFERMKEELRSGKPLASSVEDGFKRAWSSIRDSNVSSLITCVILGWFGTSLIKGFAITLGIGILLSMFSAITITRTFLRIITLKKEWKSLWPFGIRKVKEEENV
ncbi:MAG: protein translocase subunit SecD [Candidatus Kerfeldbacteria bacterium CG_4_10_14_0_8_um_filter_42_10]|uniref:Protein translocase subunit SecD n=1 Tax=Candidatus Kerfeldbacteria bacterium CG_4_10_14_0_8_um_filter_42_10 TaxID=2014248 RepID=A0A2M7RHZ4_9BACT|nr:MAG: protein translocase subunit SecD [Candidatus Kerfeldbacteria bacterium CG_4_10_14_0_8_um_filter_42_10]